MTASRRSGELLGNLPLEYTDGPDYCIVKDATGADFALTVQPELMQLMEQAALRSAPAGADVREGLEWYAGEAEAAALAPGVREALATAILEAKVDHPRNLPNEKRSFGYYASVGIDYFNRPHDTLGKLALAAADAALAVIAALSDTSERGE